VREIVFTCSFRWLAGWVRYAGAYTNLDTSDDDDDNNIRYLESSVHIMDGRWVRDLYGTSFVVVRQKYKLAISLVIFRTKKIN
jgi:hypothetical protein